MPAAAYQTVLDNLRTILKADARTANCDVFLEQDPQFGVSDSPQGALCIVLNRRSPSALQPFAAGTRQRYELSFSVWVVGFSAETFKKAAEVRDDLLGKVELVLMANRTINNAVEAMQLEGGDFINARNENQPYVFCALAEIAVRATVNAINP